MSGGWGRFTWKLPKSKKKKQKKKDCDNVGQRKKHCTVYCWSLKRQANGKSWKRQEDTTSTEINSVLLWSFVVTLTKGGAIAEREHWESTRKRRLQSNYCCVDICSRKANKEVRHLCWMQLEGDLVTISLVSFLASLAGAPTCFNFPTCPKPATSYRTLVDSCVRTKPWRMNWQMLIFAARQGEEELPSEGGA